MDNGGFSTYFGKERMTKNFVGRAKNSPGKKKAKKTPRRGDAERGVGVGKRANPGRPTSHGKKKGNTTRGGKGEQPEGNFRGKRRGKKTT